MGIKLSLTQACTVDTRRVRVKPTLSDLVPVTVFLAAFLCDFLRRCSYYSSKAGSTWDSSPGMAYISNHLTHRLFPQVLLATL